MVLWTLWDMLPLVVRKVLVFIIGVVSLIGFPIAGYVSGVSIVKTNVDGRSPWRSEQSARAGQWDWPTILLGVCLVVGVGIFVVCWLYALRGKKDSRPTYR